MEPLRGFDIDKPMAHLADPVAQWLDWEQQANLIGFRTSTRPVDVDVVLVPRGALEIHILPGAPEAMVGRFLRGDQVFFPRHPLNRDPTVAWFDAPVSERWSARFTSSRTLAMPGPESGDALFSLKLATDRPHPDFHQPEKTKLREEALGVVEWVDVIGRVDALLGPMSRTHLVTEVLVVLVRDGESGFMVRDLRLFQDGHYYLPALSLPWVGRQIARALGEPFDSLWARCYAGPIGRSKAELFARYGLWYETPNPQNVVIQLDQALRPTGHLVFRDVGDGEDATDALFCKDVPWARLTRDLRPETQCSFWAFAEAGAHSVRADVLADWYAQHDDAYYGELARWFPEVAPPADLSPAACLEHWNGALRSAQGEAAVARRFAPRASR